MKLLLYCIFSRSAEEKPETILGVEGKDVRVVSNNGLNAAISGITVSGRPPEVVQLLVYQKVIEFFYQYCTVIPMRYGCIFKEESQVFRLLEDHDRYCKGLLEEIEGCVEMGIRILGCHSLPPTTNKPALSFLPFADHHRPWATLSSELTDDNCKPCTPGRSYLTTRKMYYAREERLAREDAALTERIVTAFDGMYVKCQTERPDYHRSHSLINNSLLSLYFLVPRKLVHAFRLRFRQISREEAAKLLLSGPWPPYNFVRSEHLMVS